MKTQGPGHQPKNWTCVSLGAGSIIFPLGQRFISVHRDSTLPFFRHESARQRKDPRPVEAPFKMASNLRRVLSVRMGLAGSRHFQPRRYYAANLDVVAGKVHSRVDF